VDGVDGRSFGRELRYLYAEAGSPVLDALVLLAHNELPASDGPTVEAVESWLRDDDLPTSQAELKAFVGLLIHLAERRGQGTHTVRPLAWWESLWSKSVGQPEQQTGNQQQTPANAMPSTSPAPGPTVTSSPASPVPRPRHTNTVHGHARIDGPSVQAERIDGGVHFHEAPMLQPASKRSLRAPDDGAGVVIRVRSGSETIEIYDEGLARIWISARLQLGPGHE
jgi:hypothetical protein